MKKFLIGVVGTLLGAQLSASDSFNSEFSHAVGGAVMAGGITAVVDQWYPEYREERAMIGFWVSSIAVTLYQISEYADHGHAGGQLLDAASHIAGSALGAYVTDGYLLAPVVQHDAKEGRYVGFMIGRRF